MSESTWLIDQLPATIEAGVAPGLLGSFAWVGLDGVGLTPNADYAPTIPHQAFMLFQLMFAQDRLGPGRIFHAMRWLGQAQRAFDLMCQRLNEREAFGGPLAGKQLMQKHVFDSYTQIQASRLLTLAAAEEIDRGSQARVEIGAIKVFGAQMLHDVIDRALQVHGAAGLTDDTPLSAMYRTARFARLYDGADEVHMQSIGRRILGEYRRGDNWEFGLR